MTGQEKHLREQVTRARCARVCAIAVAAAALVPAATSLAFPSIASAADRDEAAAWSGVFDALRPIPSLDPRRVVVLFEAPSLADWTDAAKGDELDAAARQAFVRRARAEQDAQLAALRQAGIQFTVEHRYVRVVNGAALMVHGDDAQRLRTIDGVRSVSQVRAVYPSRLADANGETVSWSKAVAAAPVANPAARAAVAHDADGSARATVAVLDTGIDFNNPLLAGRQAGPGIDVLNGRVGVEPGADDSHGTNVAGGVAIGAGKAAVQILPVRVLDRQPVLGGYEAVVGSTDALLAGIEVAVDPDGNGATTDAADVILTALSVPYAGFADSPEERAVAGARALGVTTVAAAGNDGASGDGVGTVGGPAAARDALAVGAADMRDAAPRVDVHARGGVLDHTWAGSPLLTADTKLPGDGLPVIAIDGSGADVVDYLGDDARSRVGGGIVLVTRQSGVAIGDQVRAAADAGAAAVLVSGASAGEVAGVLRAPGATIAAVGISAEAGSQLRDAAREGRVEVGLALDANAGNSAFGTVAGFSSRGPRYDGLGKPDLVAPGVGVLTTGVGTDKDGNGTVEAVSGTSIAAAQVAGQVASLRSQHPGWNTGRIRAALLGTAAPLAGDGGRERVEAQGAGLPNLEAAAAAEVVAAPARIDFGIVTPGAGARSPLGFERVRSGASLELPPLASERSGDEGPLPSVDGDSLVIQVPEGTASGVYGGWLVNERDGVRVPWMLVVRQPDEFDVPLSATLSDASFQASAAPGQFPSSVQLGVGGAATSDSLGLRAAQGIQLQLKGPKGGDLGSLGSFDHVLPGVYTVGLTGRAVDGTNLAAGNYTLQVKVRSAATPRGVWVDGPAVKFTIE